MRAREPQLNPRSTFTRTSLAGEETLDGETNAYEINFKKVRA